MSGLYFRAGESEGFTSKKLADKREGYATPVRELLQNSLDASKDAKNKKCKISIYIESIKKSDIPHIKEYQDVLQQAIKFHKKENSYGRNAKQTVSFINEALKNDSLDVLMFVDNGAGMPPKILNSLIGERSVKHNESSGGSFGVGHLSSYFLSSLRYVLYASKYKDKGNGEIKTLFSGSPILAGYEDQEGIPRSNIGRILSTKPRNELKPNFTFPTTFPNFIQEKITGIETGSMVAILGLNKNWNEEAEYAIVSNFFYAINKDELTININRKDKSYSIDKIDIYGLLKNQRDQKKSKNSILAGRDVYQSWLTVQDDDCKKEIPLKNGEKICVHISNDIDSISVIALIRNGMLIARHDKMLSNSLDNLRKNEDFEPFSIIINVDDKDCPKLFELIKGAENPYHNKLERNRLSSKDQVLLKELLNDLSEKIQGGYLKKRDRTGSMVSMPLLEIPSRAEVQGVNATRPRNQKSKAQSDKPEPQPPIIKINKTFKGRKRPKPVVVSRSLESKNAVRLKDNGDTFAVNLIVTPQKIEAKDEVYLSMSLAQDSDKNEVDTGLDIVTLSIDGTDITIPDFIEHEKNGTIQKKETDKRQIKLGKLSKSQTYNIIAVVKKPKKVRGMDVALRPFLGLKKSKD